MPLIRCTSRSPATPVPYSFQQRQRANASGSKGFFGAVPCHVSQSSVCGDRSGGGGYSHAPVGSLRPYVTLDQIQFADGALLDQLLGLRAEHRTGPLRPDLHDAVCFLRGCHHLQPVGRGVRHGLFAIDILARIHRIHYHLLVPVVRNRHNNGVDILRIEKFFVAARGANRLADNLLGQFVAAVVEIGRGHALHAAQLNGGGKQAGTFHPHADNPEANPVAGRRGLCRRRDRLSTQKIGSGSATRRRLRLRCVLQKGAPRNTQNCSCRCLLMAFRSHDSSRARAGNHNPLSGPQCRVVSGAFLYDSGTDHAKQGEGTHECQLDEAQFLSRARLPARGAWHRVMGFAPAQLGQSRRGALAFARPFLTHVSVVRVNQIEVTPTRSIGEDEAADNRPERDSTAARTRLPAAARTAR